MDFYSQLRQRMIDTMQISLRRIRQVIGLGVQEFSDVVGITRQSLNNLESLKVKMSAIQFVAVCAVIDHFVESQPELMSVIISILNSNDTLYDNCVYEINSGESFLKKWFMCFPDNSKVVTVKANIIEDLTDNYKVFLDDTALCEIYDNNQGVSLIDNMYSSGKHFIIPLRAVDSLQNGLLDMSSASYKIRKGIINLQMLQNRGVSEIRGEKGDINIITTLVSVFVKFKFVYRLALITQNRKLAKSILNLNNAEIGGFQILVFYLSTDGTLHKWDISDDNSLYYEVSGDYTDSDENEYDNNNEQAEENSRLSILQEWEII